MQNTANRLLNKFDERTEKMQLVVSGEPYFDEILGEDVFPASTSYDLTGVATSYSESLVNNTSIHAGDVSLSVLCEVEPTQADKVEMDGSQYSVVNVMPASYTGKDKTIAYKVQVRK